MPRSSASSTVLFWAMFIAAGSCLAACLTLPAWLELRALRIAYARAQADVEDLEHRLTRFEKQIEHLKNDPAYIERLARKEFGLDKPGVETIPLAPPTNDTLAAGPPTVEEPPLETLIARAAERTPWMSVFVSPDTRRHVMLIAGVTLLLSIVLLHRSTRRRPA